MSYPIAFDAEAITCLPLMKQPIKLPSDRLGV